MNPYRYDIQTLERKARAVRRHIVRLNANSPAGGHTGADLSQVELLTALYFRVLNVAPDRLDDPQRDIYIQSKGHAVGCYYCVLAEVGFFPVEWLETYQHANSHLPGHPVRQKNAGHRAQHRRAGPRFACCGGAGAGREEKQQHPPHFF